MYVDPGLGAFLLQALLASVLSSFYVFRRKLSTLLRKLTGRRGPDPRPDSAPTQPDHDS